MYGSVIVIDIWISYSSRYKTLDDALDNGYDVNWTADDVYKQCTSTFSVNGDSIINDQANFTIYGKKGIIKIPDPNIELVKAMIRENCLLNDIGYVFYDYVFISPSLLNEFRGFNLRNDKNFVVYIAFPLSAGFLIK